jgi:hypothetical protein
VLQALRKAGSLPADAKVASMKMVAPPGNCGGCLSELLFVTLEFELYPTEIKCPTELVVKFVRACDYDPVGIWLVVWWCCGGGVLVPNKIGSYVCCGMVVCWWCGGKVARPACQSR